jgi:hypothetical protein
MSVTFTAWNSVSEIKPRYSSFRCEVRPKPHSVCRILEIKRSFLTTRAAEISVNPHSSSVQPSHFTGYNIFLLQHRGHSTNCILLESMKLEHTSLNKVQCFRHHC